MAIQTKKLKETFNVFFRSKMKEISWKNKNKLQIDFAYSYILFLPMCLYDIFFMLQSYDI